MPDTYAVQGPRQDREPRHRAAGRRQRGAGPASASARWADARSRSAGRDAASTSRSTSGRRRSSSRSSSVFSRQFATMVNSGLPILRALSILADQTENKELAKRPGAGAGWTSSRARRSRARWQKHPKVFNDLFVSMVKSGETGGSLDDVLLRLADMIEKRGRAARQDQVGDDVPGRRRRASSSLIMSAMLLFVVPQFKTHLRAARRHAAAADAGPARRCPTSVQKYWYIVVCSARSAARFFFRGTRRPTTGRASVDRGQAPGPGLRLAVPQDGAGAVREHARRCCSARACRSCRRSTS